LISPYI